MKPILLTMYSENILFRQIQNQLGYDYEVVTPHTFPDQETSLTIKANLTGRTCIIFESLIQPNHKILPLLFLAETARDLGAKKIGLVAPYLAYMRQDIRFHAGESITARYFSKLLSPYMDWLITIDPHLHRIHDLQEIYTIPSSVAHATSNISAWIQNNIKNPLLIGPDKESEQWVSEIAHGSKAPYLLLEKTRHSDHDVNVAMPNIDAFQSHIPVLVDDIISTAKTMIETIKHLKNQKMKPPVCIGIHGIFANNAYEELLQAGASEIVTCNTIPHVTNQIDLSQNLIEKIKIYV